MPMRPHSVRQLIMWNTTRPAGLIEMQTVVHHDVEKKVLDGQTPKPVILEMVCRDKELGATARGEEHPRRPS